MSLYCTKKCLKDVKDDYQPCIRQLKTMELPSDTSSLIKLQRLSSNSDYYNIVFKKTERIASAVFYILSYLPPTGTSRVHVDRLSEKAMALHEAVIASLNVFEHDTKDGLYPLQHALVALSSTLTIAQSARVLTLSITLPIDDEIDQVTRHLRHHYQGAEAVKVPSNLASSQRLSGQVERPRFARRPRPNIPQNDLSSDAVLVYSNLSDRTSRIKTVLDAKPGATIKDLTDIITDVSAKTIQRDLNSLIERGEVIRQGERRWSTYSIT